MIQSLFPVAVMAIMMCLPAPSLQPEKLKPWAVTVGRSWACGSLLGPWAVTGPVTPAVDYSRAGSGRDSDDGVSVSVAMGLRYRPGRATLTVHLVASALCVVACT